MLLLAAIVIGWPWLSGRVTIPWDAKAHFLPQIQFLAQSLARGELPFWAPYVFSGQPQIADPQSMIFSPPFLLLALLNSAPSLWAADATLLAMVFLGGAALMLWFRDQGWHWAGALIAALAFGYGAADGLAHPARRPGAEPRLSADHHALPGSRAVSADRSSTASPPAWLPR